MVALVFDATVIPAAPEVTLTFGRNRSEIRWNDQRAMSFVELAGMLSTATVGQKDGSCYTPAVFSGTARRKEQATRIDIAVLDADCGHSFGEIERAVTARGWRVIIHSTYSHLSDQTVISADAYDKWAADQGEGATVAAYMQAKKGYLPRVVESAQIVEELRDGQSRNYIIKHAPCPKYRIILPLQDPWRAADFDTQHIANATWRERIGALAFALRLHHDQSCVDTSRLFYLPRIRDSGQKYEMACLAGTDCPIWELPEATEATDEAGNLFTAAASRPRGPQIVDAAHKWATDKTGAPFNLTAWAAEFAGRFEVVTALRAKSPGLFGSRRSGVKYHLECPSSANHTTGTTDRTGTYAVNASQLASAGLGEMQSGFVLHCMHAGCAGTDRLDHIAALLGRGLLTASDLTDPAFLTAAPPLVDVGPILESKANRPLKDAAEEITPSNIAAASYAGLPGALGAMHAWILATSPKPQPELALGAVLSFAAAAIGQRVKLQRWGLRPNIYVLAIAHSGAGKDRQIKACKQMAREAGLSDDLIGIEEIASDAGIVASVAKHPRQVMMIDEVSFMLSATSNRQAGPHMANVPATLLKLYSSSDTSYKSKSYADSDKVTKIDQPCVSFYGATTPSGLVNALTSKEITSGLLSRMVVFDAGSRDPKGVAPGTEPVPAEVMDWLTAWNRVSPIQNPLHRVGGEQLLEPRTVMVTGEAIAIADAFEDEMHIEKLKARKRGTDALYVRARENALKFALIRACGVLPIKTDAGPAIDESALCVDAITMRWAVDLSRATVRHMDVLAGEIADTPFQETMRALRDVVRRSGERGATLRDIARSKPGKQPEKVLKELVTALVSAGEMQWVSGIKTKGRERNAYVHRDFLDAHNLENGDDE